MKEEEPLSLMMSEHGSRGALARAEHALAQGMIRDISLRMDVDAVDEEGETPLTRAVKEGNLAKVRRLIAMGANVNAANKTKHTALMRAKTLPIAEILLAHGADLHAKDDEGRSVLAHAAEGGSVEVVQFLLDRGVDLHAKDDSGQSVLMDAARGGSVEVVQFLLDRGADLHSKDEDVQKARAIAR